MFDISSICDVNRATEQLAEQLMSEFLHGIDKKKPHTITIRDHFDPIYEIKHEYSNLQNKKNTQLFLEIVKI